MPPGRVIQDHLPQTWESTFRVYEYQLFIVDADWLRNLTKISNLYRFFYDRPVSENSVAVLNSMCYVLIVPSGAPQSGVKLY